MPHHNIYFQKYTGKSCCWLLCWIMVFCPYLWAQNAKKYLRPVVLKAITEFAGLYQDIQPQIATLNGKDIRNNCFAPGKYRLDISHPAYFPVTDTLVIAKGDDALVVEKKLLAKPVKLKFSITHNISPPETAPACQFTLYPKSTMIAQKINNGELVHVGRYIVQIETPGYKVIRREVIVAPSVLPQIITEKLNAIPRSISFDIGYKGYKETEKASRIMIDGGWINVRDTFMPGSVYDAYIEFVSGKTANTRIQVEPGTGPFSILLQLDQLKIYKFSLQQNAMAIDGIIYEYELYADAIRIPEHAIQIFKNGRRFFFVIGVQPQARDLQIYSGYLFTRRALAKLHLGVGFLNKINIPRLLIHLQKLRDKDRQSSQALNAIEKMLASYRCRRQLKKLPDKELISLLKYLKSWLAAAPAEEQDRINKVIGEVKSFCLNQPTKT